MKAVMAGDVRQCSASVMGLKCCRRIDQSPVEERPSTIGRCCGEVLQRQVKGAPGEGGHVAPGQSVATMRQLMLHDSPARLGDRVVASSGKLTTQIREGQGKIFGEDLQVLEQQQRNHLQWPGRTLLKLNIDAGGVHARRIIDRLVAAERAADAGGAAVAAR